MSTGNAARVAGLGRIYFAATWRPDLAPPTGIDADPWQADVEDPGGLALDIRCLFAYTRAATGDGCRGVDIGAWISGPGCPGNDELERAGERVWFHRSRPREVPYAQVLRNSYGSEPGIENFGDYRLQSRA